jgi:hypothetical protein
MNDGVLSQQEIDFLLRGGADKKQASLLTEGESDMLGEVGNISMATAATALSQILNNKRNCAADFYFFAVKIIIQHHHFAGFPPMDLPLGSETHCNAQFLIFP